MSREQQWFTSDLHIGHANIIRFCNRPYADVNEMNADLIRRYNEVVGWEQRTDALRRLARAATEFVSEGADPDTTYPRFKEALEAWWEHAGVWG